MKYLIKNKYWSIDKNYNIDKILYLLIDRPSKINSHYNSFIWKNNKGEWHRDYDLPAAVSNDGDYVAWYINDLSQKIKETSK